MYAYILTIYVLDMQQLEFVCAQHHDNIYIKCIAEILGMYIRYEMTKSSYRYSRTQCARAIAINVYGVGGRVDE